MRRRPYSVVLFDEIEKAHPEVLNVLLQVMDDGHLTDGHGRTVDFRNAVVIMTSNLGTGEDNRGQFGFVTERSATEQERQRLHQRIEKALQGFFRPEFLNRVDEIIIFEPLTEPELRQIVDIMLDEVEGRLTERGIGLSLSDAAKDALAHEGYDRVYGAPPLRRTVEAAGGEPALEADPRRRVQRRRPRPRRPRGRRVQLLEERGGGAGAGGSDDLNVARGHKETGGRRAARFWRSLR